MFVLNLLKGRHFCPTGATHCTYSCKVLPNRRTHRSAWQYLKYGDCIFFCLWRSEAGAFARTKSQRGINFSEISMGWLCTHIAFFSLDFHILALFVRNSNFHLFLRRYANFVEKSAPAVVRKCDVIRSRVTAYLRFSKWWLWFGVTYQIGRRVLISTSYWDSN